MTNPYSGGNDDFPRYEPTNHPEDRPDYGQLPSYGGSHEDNAQGYAGYHAGQPQHTGKVSAIDAVSWAFRAVFGNWKLWILGTLLAGFLGVVFFAISGGVGAATANADGDLTASSTIMQIISWVIGIVLTLALMRLALFQIDDSRTGWGYLFKNVRWWQPLVIMVVIGIVGGLISFVAVRGSAAGLADNAEQLSDEEAFAAVMGMLGVLAVISLISFFVQPLFSLMQWFAADGDSVGDAVKKGFQAGKNNYGQMLLLAILNFFIIVN